LHISVDTAARCGGIGSTTSPCDGSGTSAMITTANTVFQPLTGATFSNNSSCSVDLGTGLRGTGLQGMYQISIGLGPRFAMNLTLTASSCYPTVTSS
jgi:hypothetical protein